MTTPRWPVSNWSSGIHVKLVVAYNGTGFHGLAPQRDVRTVVGVLQESLAVFCDTGPPSVVMSGRTDAGVHAWGQVLSFELPDTTDLCRVRRSLLSRLAPEIVVRSIQQTPDSFNARFDAVARHYRYAVLNRELPDPFAPLLSWHVADPLDIELMNTAADRFVGEHDFSSFCRRPATKDANTNVSLVRRVLYAQWSIGVEDQLRFDIGGSAFCHQMVRSLTGFLVAVGRGKRTPDEVPGVLAARDRSLTEQLAPPHGLTLYQVDYPDETV